MQKGLQKDITLRLPPHKAYDQAQLRKALGISGSDTFVILRRSVDARRRDIMIDLVCRINPQSPIAEAIGLTKIETKVGYLELPVQLQYGLDLLLLRPYIFAEPFVGYAVNIDNDAHGIKGAIQAAKDIKHDFKESNFNRFEYGLGVGAGVDLGSLQLSLKYFWNFGSLAEKDEVPNGSDITKAITKAIKDKESFNGISISLAYFF